MKKLSIIMALCALSLVANAATYNYLCAITELQVDTLASKTKNQFTLSWTQKCKNIAEYSSKPTGTYTTTVKLVLNSDDRTLEGTYTTEGASPTSSSANVNDQTINLVTSELYYGTTRRLLRSDSISTFTIIKIDDTHYGISIGRLCFTAAALADRNKHTYNYNYCYAEEEILVQGIEPKPYIFGYDSEYHAAVYNYDMTVNSINVFRDDTEYEAIRYFMTLNCSGKNREDNTERNYELQMAIYPTDPSIVGTFATQGGNLLWASNSYVKDLKANKLRYLANDSLSSIQIVSTGENQYAFFGGLLICTDMDMNYMAVYNKKRVEAVHYYHFSDNSGAGIPFSYDESKTSFELTLSKVEVEASTESGDVVSYSLNISASEDNIDYHVSVDIEGANLAGTHNTDNSLTLWSYVERSNHASYITTGSAVSIVAKGAGVYTISGSLVCENGFSYILKAFDFSYQTATGIHNVQGDEVQSTKMIENGVLYLINNGEKYNIQGAKVVK